MVAGRVKVQSAGDRAQTSQSPSRRSFEHGLDVASTVHDMNDVDSFRQYGVENDVLSFQEEADVRPSGKRRA